VWPDEELLPKFREYFTDYYAKMTELARTILRGFALASGKEETFFNDKIRLKDCMSTLRLNYYPFLEDIEAVEIASDGTRLGCETHRDGSLITILYQPIEGLQVEDDQLGWINVTPSDTNYVINTGECMSRWTNNVYQAANHRVKFMNIERASIPYFTEPHYECLIESYTPHRPEDEALHSPIKYGIYIAESNKKFKEYQR
jgi:isopenicillin-N synthase